MLDINQILRIMVAVCATTISVGVGIILVQLGLQIVLVLASSGVGTIALIYIAWRVYKWWRENKQTEC